MGARPRREWAVQVPCKGGAGAVEVLPTHRAHWTRPSLATACAESLVVEVVMVVVVGVVLVVVGGWQGRKKKKVASIWASSDRQARLPGTGSPPGRGGPAAHVSSHQAPTSSAVGGCGWVQGVVPP